MVSLNLIDPLTAIPLSASGPFGTTRELAASQTIFLPALGRIRRSLMSVEITLFANLRSLLTESDSSDCGPTRTSLTSSNVIASTAS